MKAIALPDYGPLEGLVPIDMPTPAPGRREVRVRVVASALNPADYKVLLGTMKLLHGRRRPLVVGYDFSGIVDAVGAGVEEFAADDEVYGFLPYGPRTDRGAFAELVVARVDELAMKPRTVSHEIAAAAATTGVTALQAFRDLGRLPPSARVLVTGASGGVGSIAIGVARRLGAAVTAVGSGAGLEVARALGAVDTIDRTHAALPDALGDRRFDVVLDAAAAYRWREWRSVLVPGGAFVTTLPSLTWAIDKARSVFSRTRVHFIAVKPRAADLALLASWLDDGLAVPVASTIAIRELASGLGRLRTNGGRTAVRVADGF